MSPGSLDTLALLRCHPVFGELDEAVLASVAERTADNRRRLVTRVLIPCLENSGLLDFRDFDRAAEAGYRHTLQALSEPIS